MQFYLSVTGVVCRSADVDRSRPNNVGMIRLSLHHNHGTTITVYLPTHIIWYWQKCIRKYCERNRIALFVYRQIVYLYLPICRNRKRVSALRRRRRRRRIRNEWLSYAVRLFLIKNRIIIGCIEYQYGDNNNNITITSWRIPTRGTYNIHFDHWNRAGIFKWDNCVYLPNLCDCFFELDKQIGKWFSICESIRSILISNNRPTSS